MLPHEQIAPLPHPFISFIQHLFPILYSHQTAVWPPSNRGFPLNQIHFDWCARAPVAEFRSGLTEAPLCHSTEPHDVLLLRLYKVHILPLSAVIMARVPSAPPRRKSCGACVAAKRRCDLAVPSCSRCLQRNVLCLYPGRQPSANPPSSGVTESQDGSWQLGTLVLPVHAENSPCHQPDITNIHLPMGSEWNSIDDLQADIPIDPSWDLLVLPRFELAMRRTKPLKPLSEIIASKLQFTVDVLKNAPSMMVLETQLPWCHPQLYKKYMPRAMQGNFDPTIG